MSPMVKTNCGAKDVSFGGLAHYLIPCQFYELMPYPRYTALVCSSPALGAAVPRWKTQSNVPILGVHPRRLGNLAKYTSSYVTVCYNRSLMRELAITIALPRHPMYRGCCAVLVGSTPGSPAVRSKG